MEQKKTCIIPADVPERMHETFTNNYHAITRETGRLFIFSCDHKIEHLNNDFYGENIHPQALHPEHIFRIASQGTIGALATHLGLIARYAKQYSTVNYIAKLNSTSHIGQSGKKSYLLWSIDDVLHFKNNNNKIQIPGVGITIYLGNEYTAEHLAQAAQVINQAHAEGLVTIAWIYIQGEELSAHSPELIAGAAGVGTALGADFIKIKKPETTPTMSTIQALKIAAACAGNSKIICAGGPKTDLHTYLQELYEEINQGDTAGTATGRNIFQLSLPESIALTHAISAIVYENADYQTALDRYNTHAEKKLP